MKKRALLPYSFSPNEKKDSLHDLTDNSTPSSSPSSKLFSILICLSCYICYLRWEGMDITFFPLGQKQQQQQQQLFSPEEFNSKSNEMLDAMKPNTKPSLPTATPPTPPEEATTTPPLPATTTPPLPINLPPPTTPIASPTCSMPAPRDKSVRPAQERVYTAGESAMYAALLLPKI